MSDLSGLCGCGFTIDDPACCTNTPEVLALVARDEAMDALIAALDEPAHLDGDTAAKREAEDREALWLDGYLSGYAAGEY